MKPKPLHKWQLLYVARVHHGIYDSLLLLNIPGSLVAILGAILWGGWWILPAAMSPLGLLIWSQFASVSSQAMRIPIELRPLYAQAYRLACACLKQSGPVKVGTSIVTTRWLPPGRELWGGVVISQRLIKNASKGRRKIVEVVQYVLLPYDGATYFRHPAVGVRVGKEMQVGFPEVGFRSAFPRGTVVECGTGVDTEPELRKLIALLETIVAASPRAPA